MKRELSLFAALGAIAGGLGVGGISAGCGSNKSGGWYAGAGGAAGIGGGAPGQGGATATGGLAANGGITGTSSGLASTGGRATGGNGTGGFLSGTVGTGGGMGGTIVAGTGGKTTGGVATGGMSTGGVTTIDAGAADGPPAKCSELGDQAACDLRNDCHSVFDDPGTCDCATPGCCARFQHCADGNTANCFGPALCKRVAPRCEGPYVIAYSGDCYEGCVRKVECALPNCPQAAPKNGTECETVDHACFYEDCAAAGRTLAACSAGAWQVESGACAPFECQGGGATPQPQTCVAGRICVSTTSGGGAYMVTPECVDHTCGTGPISLACISSASGTCNASYSLAGVVVKCQLPFSGAP